MLFGTRARISRPLLDAFSTFFLLFDLLLPDVEDIAGFSGRCKSSLQFSNDPKISSFIFTKIHSIKISIFSATAKISSREFLQFLAIAEISAREILFFSMVHPRNPRKFMSLRYYFYFCRRNVECNAMLSLHLSEEEDCNHYI